MRILNAFKLAFANVKVVVKSMFLRLILFVLALVCVYVWFYTALKDFFASESWIGLCDNIKKCFSSYVSGENGSGYAHAISDEFAGCIKVLIHEKGSIMLAVGGVLLIFCIFSYLMGLADYGSAYLVSDYMNSLIKSPYIASIFKDFRKNLLFCLINLLIGLLSFALFTAFCCVMLLYGMKIFSVLAFPIIIIVYVMGKALKRTLLSQALPSVIVGKKGVLKAYGSSGKAVKGHFQKEYITYLVATLANFYIQVSGAVFTFGASLIITIPFAHIFFTNLQFIDYSLVNGIKFYSDFDHVVVPKNLREHDENLLTGIDMD